MMHIAMFDAVNAIEHAYTPYRFEVRASRGASHGGSGRAGSARRADGALPDTAARPSMRCWPRNWRICRRAETSKGSRSAALSRGQSSNGGRTTAGRQRLSPDPTYVLPLTPGQLAANAARVQLRHVHLLSERRCRSGSRRARSFCRLRHRRSPASAMREDFNETKSLGSATSDVRTAEQTEIALRIAAVGFSTPPVEPFFRVAADVARTQGLSLVDTARLFAFVSVADTTGCRHPLRVSSPTVCGGRSRRSAAPMRMGIR